MLKFEELKPVRKAQPILNEKECILIIDDNEDILQATSYILEKRGYKTETAKTGKEAIEKAQKKSYNLVLLDLKLPDMTGLELLSSLKLKYPRLDVIIITGNPELDSTIRALKEGVVDYFIKPLKIEHLLFSIKNSLEKQHLVVEKQKVEDNLRDSEEKYRDLYENAPNAYFSIGNDKLILRCNKAAVKLLGYTEEELLKMKIFELCANTEEGIEKATKLFQRFLAGTQIRDEELQMRRKNGELVWISLTVRALLNPIGDVIESLSMVIDISKRKQIEKELFKLNKLKSEILTRASHELKTPLASIIGYSDLFQLKYGENLNEDSKKILNEIQKGCSRLKILTENILKTAELRSESVKLNKSQEDLSLIIKNCVDELKGFIDRRNHSVNLKIHNKLITNLEKDEIHQVLTNLLINAINYTPPNGVIITQSEIKNKSIIISVKDNGVGFNKEEKVRLFTQYGKIERYGQGLDVISDGSGLGLYISKKIIELHGGKIWAESEGRNKGSTFTFSLPIIDV